MGLAAAGKLEMRGRGMVMLGIGAWLLFVLALFFLLYILVPPKNHFNHVGGLLVDTARNGRQITVENHIKLGLKGLSCV